MPISTHVNYICSLIFSVCFMVLSLLVNNEQLHDLYSSSSASGTELPLVSESYGLLNDTFPFPSILDAGYPIFNLHLANVLFAVILPSVLGSSLYSFG